MVNQKVSEVETSTGIIKKLSIIVSVYNEEKVLDLFYETIKPVLLQLDREWELMFVNDGSKDASAGILSRLAQQDSWVKVIHFSRNFGHESAMLAGLDLADGDGFIFMDSDLQHPVELIPEILGQMDEGYEVITMVRLKNQNAGFVKNLTSSTFYKVLNLISDVRFEENVSDFFAFTAKPAKVLRDHYRESNRFMRAYVQDIGFRKTYIEYEAKDRAAGESKYSIRKLIRFSIQALISYSDIPLKISIGCGTVTALACILMIIYSVYMKIAYGAPSGYSTLIVMICFLFAVLFFLLGIMGEYIALLVHEIRDRPIYTVRKTENIKEDRQGS